MATAVRHLNGMSEQARACLRKAAACERAAVLATEPATQATYRELAIQYREMVNSYGDLDRLRGRLGAHRRPAHQINHARFDSSFHSMGET